MVVQSIHLASLKENAALVGYPFSSEKENSIPPLQISYKTPSTSIQLTTRSIYKSIHKPTLNLMIALL